MDRSSLSFQVSAHSETDTSSTSEQYLSIVARFPLQSFVRSSSSHCFSSRIRISRMTSFYCIHTRLYRLLRNPACMLNVQQSFGRKATESDPSLPTRRCPLCFFLLRWQSFASFSLYRCDTVFLKPLFVRPNCKQSQSKMRHQFLSIFWLCYTPKGRR